jgi:hypothetical protein
LHENNFIGETVLCVTVTASYSSLPNPPRAMMRGALQGWKNPQGDKTVCDAAD